MKHYRVWDNHNKTYTGGVYCNLTRAIVKAYKLDKIYGGYRYFVKTLESEF
jgi:hypothetical protein